MAAGASTVTAPDGSVIYFVDAALGADRRQLIKQYIENAESAPKLADRIWQALWEMSQSFTMAYQSALETAVQQVDNARLRYFDPVRKRAGVPEDVFQVIVGRGDVGAAGRRCRANSEHVHQRTAPEVDAEIQPVGEEQRDRQDRQQRRDRKADAPKAHEIERRVVRSDQAGLCPALPAARRRSESLQRASRRVPESGLVYHHRC